MTRLDLKMHSHLKINLNNRGISRQLKISSGPVNIQLIYLGQDPGGFMNDGPKVADLFIGEVSNVWEFQGLEGETLSRLGKGCIDVLIKDAATSGEREGTVWG